MTVFRTTRRILAAIAIAAAVTTPAVAQGWGPGDRVLGQWSNGKWHPARVADWSRGNYYIVFDDGDTAWVDRDGIRPFSWGPGTPVECKWQAGDKYFSGTIERMRGSAIFVAYDDGDSERTDVRYCRSGPSRSRHATRPWPQGSARDVARDPEAFLDAIERNQGRR